MKPMSDSWPLYFAEMVHTQNKEHHVGIVTLWAKKEIYMKRIDKSLYNTIGQLYSREEGLSMLVRNLLANKNITDLVMVGVDLNNCACALRDFFEKGVDDDNKVFCEHESRLDENIPKEAIEKVRKNVKFHDLMGEKDPEKLNKYIRDISKKEPYGDWEEFPLPEVKVPDIFPSDHSVYKVSAGFVGEAWYNILKLINKFGIEKKSQYGENQKELICLTSVITKEDPDDPKWFDYFQFTKEELENYFPQVISDKGVEGMSYTYGTRLRNHKGIDQVQRMIDVLKKENYSRRAIAFTWNVEEDYNNPKSPCLDLVHALVQEGKLYMTCYIRSNDMFDAWPRNAFALRKLQKMITQEIGLTMGNLIIISNSAHYYARSYNKVAEILEKPLKKVSWNQDLYGTIAIKVIDNKIHMTHMSPSGSKLEEFEARTANEAYKMIAEKVKISEISHAMDVGAQLKKAEISIQLGIEFIQDKALEIKNPVHKLQGFVD